MPAPSQTVPEPVITPAATGSWEIVTGNGLDTAPFPQRLFPYTVISPETAVVVVYIPGANYFY